MKIICLVNSFGPMGSSVISSVLEHMGFLNLPLRKLKLDEYLMGFRNMKDKTMIKNFLNRIEDHKKPQFHGGVSVISKNKKINEKSLINFNLIKDEIKSLNTKNYSSAVELYIHLREIYNNALNYKNSIKNYKGHVELTVKLHKYNTKKLYKVYLKNFDEVYFINVNRNFITWFSSLSGQWFSKKKINLNFFFYDFRKVYDEYQQYQKYFSNAPGLKIDFNDIFDPKKNIIKEISKYVNFDYKKKNWKNLNYDLYGKIENYETTFKKFDDKINILNSLTKKFLEYLIKSNFRSYLYLILFKILFFIDSFKFNFLMYKFRSNDMTKK